MARGVKARRVWDRSPFLSQDEVPFHVRVAYGGRAIELGSGARSHLYTILSLVCLLYLSTLMILRLLRLGGEAEGVAQS